MKKSLGILLTSLIIVASPAWADRDRRGGDGDERPHVQKNRPGSGSARRIERNGREQRAARERDEAREPRPQGRLSREEREALHRDLDEIGRDIYRRERGR